MSVAATSPVEIETPRVSAPRKFYPALQGLRGIAFLAVFASHYLYVPWGWCGVDLFFVLSGFLITGILYDTAGDEHRARNFYARRTLRIFPLYYAVLAVLFIIRWHQLSAGWAVWPLYLGNYGPMFHLPSLITNGRLESGPEQLYLGHFWSLCVEEQFYLFWPWVVFAVRDRRKLMVLCALSVPLCLAGRLLAAQWWDFTEIARFTPLRVDALLLGGWLALAIRGTMRERVLRFMHRAYLPLLAMCGVLILVANQPWPSGSVHWPSVAVWGVLLVDVTSFVLIGASLEPGTLAYTVFSNRTLMWLGGISYGLYVFHDIPHPWYTQIATHLVGRHVTMSTAAIALPATLAISWLSSKFLERPFLKLKSAFGS